jgi:hypothetical protein
LRLDVSADLDVTDSGIARMIALLRESFPRRATAGIFGRD